MKTNSLLRCPRRLALASALAAALAAPAAVRAKAFIVDQSLGNSPYTISGTGNTYGLGFIDGDTTTGLVNHTGGLAGVTGQLIVGNAAGSTGTYNFTGGTTVTTSTSLVVGNAGTGTFNQSVGTVTPGTQLILGSAAGSNGTYNLNGGTLNTSGVTNGTGASTFNFGGGILRAAANSSNFLQVNTLLRTGAAANFDSNGFTITVAQPILATTGDATDNGLIKNGLGTLVLTGANTYTGTTTVQGGGTLQIGNGGTSGSLGTGAVSLNAAADTLAFSRSDSVTAANVISGAGSLTQNGPGTLTLTGNNTYTGTTTIGTGGTLQIGSGGTSGSLGTGLVVDNGTLAFSRSDNVSVANVISGTGSLTQNGLGTLSLTGNNTYSGATNVNAGTLTVTGGTLGGGAASINLSSGTTFNQSGGTVTAGGGLFVNGSATVNLTGGTLVVASVGNGQPAVQGTVNFNGATVSPTASNASLLGGNVTYTVGSGGLTFNTAGFNVGLGQPLGGTGGLTKTGAGTLTLGAANGYTGTTNVNAGTLAVTGSLNNGGVAVASGGTLAGNGTINGIVFVQNGGTLTGASGTAPGAAPGALTIGGANNLILTSGSALAITLASTGNDRVNAGALTLGGNLSVSFASGFTPASGQTFTILENTGAGSTAGTFANAPGGVYTDAHGDTFQVNYQANVDNGSLSNDVTLTVVPEPGTWAGGALLLGAGVVVLRRRRRAVLPA